MDESKVSERTTRNTILAQDSRLLVRFYDTMAREWWHGRSDFSLVRTFEQTCVPLPLHPAKHPGTKGICSVAPIIDLSHRASKSDSSGPSTTFPSSQQHEVGAIP